METVLSCQFLFLNILTRALSNMSSYLHISYDMLLMFTDEHIIFTIRFRSRSVNS